MVYAMATESSDPFANLEDDSAMNRRPGARRNEDEDSIFDGDEPRAKKVETFPCMSCHGTGKFRGVRVHQQQSECFACGGLGYHNKPHQIAMQEKRERKAKRGDGVRRAQNERREAFESANPGLLAWMHQQEWSEFLREMAAKVVTPAGLSENQLAAVLRTKAKQDERKAQKQAERASNAAEVDLGAIHAMFDKASSAGLSKLAYRAEGLVLSPAKSTSANAGGIYVKTVGGTYLGKVMGTKFMAGYDAKPEHKAALETIAKNPAEAAAAYGKRTGKCSCCGRELTDKRSIELGIGPICAEKWF